MSCIKIEPSYDKSYQDMLNWIVTLVYTCIYIILHKSILTYTILSLSEAPFLIHMQAEESQSKCQILSLTSLIEAAS